MKRQQNLVEESEKEMRIRGIEPRSVPWEGTMIPLHQMRICMHEIMSYYFNI